MADTAGTDLGQQVRTRSALECQASTMASVGVDIPTRTSCTKFADLCADDNDDGALATSPDGDADFPIFYGTPPIASPAARMSIALFNGITFVEACVVTGSSMDLHDHLDDMLFKHMIHNKFSNRDASALIIPTDTTGTCITRDGWTVKTAVIASAE